MNKPDPMTLDVVLDALAEKVAKKLDASTDTPRWRTVTAEAQRRGFPSARALRDWCREHAVALRGSGKHQVVGVAELDAALDRIPAREERKPARAEADDDAAILAKAGMRIIRSPKGR